MWTPSVLVFPRQLCPAAGEHTRGRVVAMKLQSEAWADAGHDRVRTTWLGRLASRWRGRVLIAVFGGTAIGWIFSLRSLMNPDYHHSLRMYLTEFWAWGLITPLVMALDRRLPFSGKELGKRVGAH